MTESTVKKSFLPLVTMLQGVVAENPKARIADVMEKVIELSSPKSRSKSDGNGSVSTMIKDAEGNVVAIHDYYFKRWMPLIGEAAVAFGKKASSASGLASMCNEGTSLWTKQQREAKNALADILVRIEKGELQIADISAEKEAIEATRTAIADTELGFATAEEINGYLVACGVDLTETDTVSA